MDELALKASRGIRSHGRRMLKSETRGDRAVTLHVEAPGFEPDRNTYSCGHVQKNDAPAHHSFRGKNLLWRPGREQKPMDELALMPLAAFGLVAGTD